MQQTSFISYFFTWQFHKFYYLIFVFNTNRRLTNDLAESQAEIIGLKKQLKDSEKEIERLKQQLKKYVEEVKKAEDLLMHKVRV